jgi:hypothetical protein
MTTPELLATIEQSPRFAELRGYFAATSRVGKSAQLLGKTPPFAVFERTYTPLRKPGPKA